VSLGNHYQVLQGGKSLPQHPTLFRQSHLLFGLGSVSKIVSLFVKRPAEAVCGIEVPESSHWIIPLFDASVILLQPIVQVAARPVYNFAPQYPMDGTRVSNMTIGSHTLRSMAHYFFGLFEEPLRCNHVTPL
jgi:hypothetical protein